jgi:hypothetical protein
VKGCERASSFLALLSSMKDKCKGVSIVPELMPLVRPRQDDRQRDLSNPCGT